jgi:hypothetical protein
MRHERPTRKKHSSLSRITAVKGFITLGSDLWWPRDPNLSTIIIYPRWKSTLLVWKKFKTRGGSQGGKLKKKLFFLFVIGAQIK